MDVNQFVADEDESSFSCRISGKLCLSLLSQIHVLIFGQIQDLVSYAYMYMQKLMNM